MWPDHPGVGWGAAVIIIPITSPALVQEGAAQDVLLLIKSARRHVIQMLMSGASRRRHDVGKADGEPLRSDEPSPAWMAGAATSLPIWCCAVLHLQAHPSMAGKPRRPGCVFGGCTHQAEDFGTTYPVPGLTLLLLGLWAGHPGEIHVGCCMHHTSVVCGVVDGTVLTWTTTCAPPVVQCPISCRRY